MVRLVPMMTTFPGMTPAAIWELDYREWLLLAHATDVRMEELRKAR